MRTRVPLVAVATAAVLVGGITGCSRTTPGNPVAVGQTGSSFDTTFPRPTVPSTRSTAPRSTSPRTSAPRTPSGDPGDPLTITCKDYLELDPSAQSDVVEEIVSQDGSILGPGDVDVATSLADALCTFLPQGVVSEILLGGMPQ